MRYLITIFHLLIPMIIIGQESIPYLPINKSCKASSIGYISGKTTSLTWNGACKNKKVEGYGTLRYFNNEKEIAFYSGNVKQGIPNGQGNLTTSNQIKIEGNFINGLLEGQGKITYADTTLKLVGNFKNGEFFNLDEKYLNLATKNYVFSQDPTELYVNNNDGDGLFYWSIIPKKQIKGTIVLLPGSWETVEMMLSGTKQLCEKSIDEGIAIIGLSINQRITLTEDISNFLNTALEDAINKYKLPQQNFVFGGFSSGGTFSLRYTQIAATTKTMIQPKAIFSVDVPTDLKEMNHNYQVALIENPNNYEANYAISEFNKYIGGAPDTHYQNYIQHAPFIYADANGGNAIYLKQTPIRIYCDVDPVWWLNNRGKDLYHVNALNQTALISLLNKIGNTEAQFINAYQKGYRLDGSRHTHA